MNQGSQVHGSIDETLCNGCGQCVVACPAGALAMEGERATLADPGACSYCADCEDLCPQGAISLPFVVEFEEPEE
jgi:hydrogenase-4 component H